MNNDGWTKIGECPVDAGCLVLVDPCYVAHEEDRTDPYQEALMWDKEDHARGHKEMSDGLGVIVSTGYGDGQYPVYVRRTNDGRIAAVMVDFNDGMDDDEACTIPCANCGDQMCDGGRPAGTHRDVNASCEEEGN